MSNTITHEQGNFSIIPNQQHIDAGRFTVNTGAADNGHAYTAAKFTPKGINWIAGERVKYQFGVAV